MGARSRTARAHRLQRAFALAAAGIVAVILAVSGYVAVGRQRSELTEIVRARSEIVLDLIARLATPALVTFDFYSPDPYMAKLDVNPDVVYAAILDQEGKVARETKRKPAEEISDGTRSIVAGGRELGRVHLSLSLESVNRLLRGTTLTVAAQTGVAALLLSVAIYLAFAGLVVAPLGRLRVATQGLTGSGPIPASQAQWLAQAAVALALRRRAEVTPVGARPGHISPRATGDGFEHI